ncbi:MAG TPA: DNA repair protein RadC, partial [candidate division WWE3 bacterium]|nr:DNA repair protein RadC [candidate division WWE3 bacterium]
PLKIQEIPCSERPRERLIKFGPESLSDSELLSVVLRSGGPQLNALDLSQELLREFGSVHRLLYADLNQLRKVKYLGLAKVCGIKAIGELCKRSLSNEELNRPKLDTPEKIFALIRPYTLGKSVECLYLLSLDINNKLLKTSLLSFGSSNQALVDVREILKCALNNDATSIILVHNHPSNNADPSPEDVNMTKRVAEAALLVGLVFIDHLVVTDKIFFSFKTSGLLSSTLGRR